MSVDNDTILPDERTRHWMVAQTHSMFEKGLDAHLDRRTRIEAAADPDNAVRFNPPSDVDRARAKNAYDII
jgi:hypothetical protein